MKNLKIKIGKTAVLEAYLINCSSQIDRIAERPAIIICPGGGYERIVEREAEVVAIKMLSLGFQAFVLHYTVELGSYPAALTELAESVRRIRNNAEKWQINPNKIMVAGFSAGGHLAASLGVFWQDAWLARELGGDSRQWQPNGLLLAYPVISSGIFGHQASFINLLGKDLTQNEKKKQSLELQVGPAVPNCFIWHTAADQTVPVENSLLFSQALSQHNIPFALHIFPSGQHGLSLATQESAGQAKDINAQAAVWPQLFEQWFQANINKSEPQ
ncbi:MULTISPECIES: alpha/beta hydrolase [unclassified Enterococcus]|uniref:alpha/beta hydrolase n=1 Tax=unclassified Enterococcus TaxID=2608891 RepID=UPI0015564C27|nr:MULTISPECIES: alpha/beta hydrolase [unclassified Enterococcus]MBS7577760.1 alpha/beta hydrolase [Enterococcus sp. MMGLQ5-2]MBS7584046.1 alpha/beta hydrolase [Enterococcus sp. MMGLQ5-1]NPD11907.1 alpha/beta hydrolase [Enterococcus sp. MMGLQ5-1]NPD37590.1 alpha/beta hydrolase [Enterococcus sp. MMGLQ5-2]